MLIVAPARWRRAVLTPICRELRCPAARVTSRPLPLEKFRRLTRAPFAPRVSRAMRELPVGLSSSHLVAVLGPTNTGKTHLAVERMLAHSTGMIGLPLRLLAREIYDRVVKAERRARSPL